MVIHASLRSLNDRSNAFYGIGNHVHRSTKTMTQEQLTKFLTMSENIQEQIQIAGELWDLSNFEIDALCGIVSDEFEANGITMGALI